MNEAFRGDKRLTMFQSIRVYTIVFHFNLLFVIVDISVEKYNVVTWILYNCKLNLKPMVATF